MEKVTDPGKNKKEMPEIKKRKNDCSGNEECLSWINQEMEHSQGKNQRA